MIVTVNDIEKFYEKNEIMIFNNNADKNILLIGSCRITAILNYLINHHELFGNKYNYLVILVHVQEMIQLSKTVVSNDFIKKQIRNSSILISEYTVKYNYFNTSTYVDKNLYQIYDSFAKKILLPNWPDTCLYVRDLIKYKSLKDYLHKFIKKEIDLQNFGFILQNCQKKELERFFEVVKKAGFTELIPFIKSNLKTNRLSNTINHPTNLYFIELYRIIIEKHFASPGYVLPKSVIDSNNVDFLSNDFKKCTSGKKKF